MLDNTIIAYSHDNGGVPYAGALNYPLRGAKATAYEGGCRSPGFIHAPKMLPTGHHTGLFHVSDYFPTLLSIASRMSGDNKTNTVTEDDTLDGVDQVDALIDGTSARDSVHIHRDFALNTHIYRKGDWKLIVGHHSIPFIFTQVYTEPEDGWIIDQGSLSGRIVEMVLSLTNMVVGQDNFLFLKYLIWFRTNAYLIGGWNNFPFFGGPRDIYRAPFTSDLETFMKNHTAINPKVSLFNLKTDPQEMENVAQLHPELVKQLLAEAESQVRNAPPEIVGNLIDYKAPSGTLYKLSITSQRY